MILGLDGASTDLSVAIGHDGGVEEESWSSDRRQSAELLPRTLALLDRSGMTLDRLEAVAVGTGPGSFTGLRVAMALAKGIAFATGRPIVGIPSLLAWLEADAEAAAALARAGAREAYLLRRGEESAHIVDRDGLPDLVGGESVVAPAELAAAFDIADARTPRGAVALVRMASRRLAERPEGDDLRRLEPIYLRAPRGVGGEVEGRVTWL